jgi:hypothetical protein
MARLSADFGISLKRWFVGGGDWLYITPRIAAQIGKGIILLVVVIVRLIRQ